MIIKRIKRPTGLKYKKIAPYINEGANVKMSPILSNNIIYELGIPYKKDGCVL